MAELKKDTEHSGIENVGHALTNVELFVENNQKIITYIVLAVLAIVLGFIGVKKYYLAPLNLEAHNQMFVAEQYFQKDSFNLALNGDGNNWGFTKIIDEYGVTKAANLAHYYAGICYFKLGKYQNAIEQLEKFSANDKLVSPIAIGTIGDSYVELGNNSKAIKYYIKAAKKSDNELTAPVYLMKAGLTSEELGDNEQALKYYKLLKEKYPVSMEGRDIDKYITRTELKVENKK
jgi:tetratricopeptide (TPR) repeat protein